jgi:hypothetical protein
MFSRSKGKGALETCYSEGATHGRTRGVGELRNAITLEIASGRPLTVDSVWKLSEAVIEKIKSEKPK